MTNSYTFQWSDYAISELQQIYDYLLANFGETSMVKLSFAIQSVLDNIQQNPKLYQVAPTQIQTPHTIRKAIILRYNTLYFTVDDEQKIINILVFFSNRQNPNRLETFFNQLI